MDILVKDSPQFPTNHDPFSSFLAHLKVKSSLYCFSTLSAPWGLKLPPMDGHLMLHLVTDGQCFIQAGNYLQLLEAGSIVLVPHGKGHSIKSEKNASVIPFFDSGVRQITPNLELLDIPGKGSVTKVMCGVVSFDHIFGQYLLEQLPDIICLHCTEYQNASWINSSIELIRHEAEQLKVGSETIITRLAEILIVKTLRYWLDNASLAHEGWFVAMRNERIGTALREMHRYPENNWNLTNLSAIACMSRSAFSAKFTELVGTSVKSYLTKWRLTLAFHKLQHDQMPILDLALSSGYQSEAAFSRAFKRVIGLTPSQARCHKQQRFITS